MMTTHHPSIRGSDRYIDKLWLRDIDSQVSFSHIAFIGVFLSRTFEVDDASLQSQPTCMHCEMPIKAKERICSAPAPKWMLDQTYKLQLMHNRCFFASESSTLDDNRLELQNGRAYLISRALKIAVRNLRRTNAEEELENSTIHVIVNLHFQLNEDP